MFGYIKPKKCELKLKEYDFYRAVYCGLCHALGKNCGAAASFAVNYDFVFGALLLMPSGDLSVKKRRCVCSLRGKPCVESDEISYVADMSVVLSYLKLEDDVRDEKHFFGRMKAFLGKILLRGAYKRAKRRIPQYVKTAEKLFCELCELEDRKIPSIDRTADKFASMLSAIPFGETAKDTALREILYHTGRFIYIIDALDDMAEDVENGEYNPVCACYGITSLPLPEDTENAVLSTLEMSRRTILSDFELIAEDSVKDSVIRNIIEFGMKDSINRIITKGV